MVKDEKIGADVLVAAPVEANGVESSVSFVVAIVVVVVVVDVVVVVEELGVDANVVGGRSSVVAKEEMSVDTMVVVCCCAVVVADGCSFKAIVVAIDGSFTVSLTEAILPLPLSADTLPSASTFLEIFLNFGDFGVLMLIAGFAGVAAAS